MFSLKLLDIASFFESGCKKSPKKISGLIVLNLSLGVNKQIKKYGDGLKMTKKKRPDHNDRGALDFYKKKVYILTTFEAAGPFCPSTISKLTFSPSFKVLKPSS